MSKGRHGAAVRRASGPRVTANAPISCAVVLPDVRSRCAFEIGSVAQSEANQGSAFIDELGLPELVDNVGNHAFLDEALPPSVPIHVFELTETLCDRFAVATAKILALLAFLANAILGLGDGTPSPI